MNVDFGAGTLVLSTVKAVLLVTLQMACLLTHL